MPKSVNRNPFLGHQPVTGRPRSGLRTPQARVLEALVPQYPEDPVSEWPLVSRAQLAVRAGYTVISGTVTRALNGIRPGNRTSGDPHLGLLKLGLVEQVEVDVDGAVEIDYRATPAGVLAYQEYAATGPPPKVKDARSCTNDRYLAGKLA